MSTFADKLKAKADDEAQRLGKAFGSISISAGVPVTTSSSNVVPLPPVGDTPASTTPLDTLRFSATTFRGTYATRYGGNAAVEPLTRRGELSHLELFALLAPGDAPTPIGGGRRDAGPGAIEAAKRAKAIYALPAQLAPGAARSAETVREAFWLAIDLDGIAADELERVRSRLRASGVAFLAYSTFSDGLKDVQAGRRVRVILPYDRPATKGEHRQAYRAACSWLHIEGDEAAAKPEQLVGCWCAPDAACLRSASVGVPAFAPFKETGGTAALSVDKLLARAARESVALSTGVSLPAAAAVLESGGALGAGLHPPASAARLAEALVWCDPGCSYDEWIRMGESLKACAQSIGEDAALRLWLDWSATAPADRRAPLDGPESSAAKWTTFRPSMPLAAAEGVLCSTARDGALYTVRAARGAPSWPAKALDALLYLQAHHRDAAAEFGGNEYPTQPQSALTGPRAASPAAVAVGVLEEVVERIAINQEGTTVAVGPFGPGGAREVVALTDRRLSDMALARLFDSGGRTVGKDAWEQSRAVLAARASQRGDRVQVYARLAPVGAQAVVLDLGAEGLGVRVDANGCNVTTEHGALFRRRSGYGALPVPAGLGVSPAEALDTVTRWLTGMGMSERDALLVTVALVRWLIPSGTFVILELIGPAGSGKTTRTFLLASLIDPQSDGTAVSPRTLDTRELMAAGDGAAVLVFDNESRRSADDQDTAARVATGATFTTRELNTTADVRNLRVHARMIFNGINPSITRADLRDRAVQVQLSAPAGGFRAGDVLRSEFEARRPDLLGALCVMLSAAFRHWGEVGPAEHRLVEYVTTGKAVMLAAGRSPNDFTEAFASHRADVARTVSEGDPLLRALLPALDAMASGAMRSDDEPRWAAWAEGKAAPGHAAIEHSALGSVVFVTPAAMVSAITKQATPAICMDWRERDAIPSHPRALECALRRVDPTLKALGWTASKREFGAKRTAWVFTRQPRLRNGP